MKSPFNDERKTPMHRTLRGTAAAAALLVLSGALVACSTDLPADTPSGGTGGGTAPDVAFESPEAGLDTSYPEFGDLPDDFTVGFMNIFSAIPSLKAGQDAAQKAVEDAGGTFLAKDDQLDVTTQVNHCNEFLSQGVDALLLYPLDPSALTPCFTAAKDAGVVVVLINSPISPADGLIDGTSADIIQGFDNAAYQRAKLVAETAPGSSYAIIGLAAPVAALAFYAERQKYWADQFGLEFTGQIDAQTDNAAGASTAASAILAKYPDVGTIFTYNDNTALATATTAKSSGRADARVLGSDGQTSGVDAVKSGALFATVWIDWATIGKNQADAALSLLADPNADIAPFVATNVELVTKDNADSITTFG